MGKFYPKQIYLRVLFQYYLAQEMVQTLFTTDERLKLFSFTGSPDVGWGLKAKAGKKKVVLELGGNAAVILDADTDIDDAVERIILEHFINLAKAVYLFSAFIFMSRSTKGKEKLIETTISLKTGDPKSEDTFVGPMIAESEAIRLDEWIGEAVKKGATLLCGGKRERLNARSHTVRECTC